MNTEETVQHVVIPVAPPNVKLKQHPVSEQSAVCRVCLSADVDPDGEAALTALGISSPECSHVHASDAGVADIADKAGPTVTRADVAEPTVIATNIVMPKIDEEKGLKTGELASEGCSSKESSLIALGCACRSEMAMAHYSCALRWFVLRGEAVCEVCGQPAETVRTDDVATVMAALEERRRGILVQELVSPQFSIRDGEDLGSSVTSADRPLGDYHIPSLNQRTGAENSDSQEGTGQLLSTEGQTGTNFDGNQSTSGRMTAVTVTVMSSPSRESFGGGDPQTVSSPSRNHRLAIALAEHKALLDAIGWFDLQHGDDSFEQVGVLPLSRLRGLWRGDSDRQPFPRPGFCLSGGTCQFFEACITIFAMALLAFGFSRIFNKFLSTKLSDMGLDFVMGGAVAILIVIWFRLRQPWQAYSLLDWPKTFGVRCRFFFASGISMGSVMFTWRWVLEAQMKRAMLP